MYMNFEEIQTHVFPEDKMMVAVKHEVDYTYVNKIISGTREARSETAQKIVDDLSAMAELNLQAKYLKAEYLKS
jgi:hypothetical protein